MCTLHVGAFYQAILTLFLFQNGAKHAFGHLGGARVPGGKTHLWPFFDPLLIPKWGISIGFGAKWSLKMATNSLKRGSECVFQHPKWPRVVFEKTRFRPLLGPKWAFRGRTATPNCPKRGQGSPGQTCPWALQLVQVFVRTHFRPLLGPNHTHTIYGRNTGQT